MLTINLVKNAHTVDGKTVEIPDSGGVSGFYLRVFATGNKRYVYKYRDTTGHQRRITIGDATLNDLATARSIARQYAAAVDRGENPAVEKATAKNSETFAEVCDLYLELHARPNKVPRSAAMDEYYINRFLLPRWQDLKAGEVTRKHVLLALDEIKLSGATQANRVKALMSKIFSFALDREIITSTPCFHVPKPARENSRDRVLTQKEIKALWLMTYPDELALCYYKVLLLTGQRPGEVAGLAWSELDGDIWNIPSARSKNRQAHRVFLTEPVKALLVRTREINAERKKVAGRGLHGTEHYDLYAFPSRYGGYAHWINKQAREIVKALKCDRWTPHDLRRTMSTHLEDAGVSADTIDAMQNHKKQGIRATYQRGNRWTQCVDAWKLWAELVEKFVNEKT